MPATHGRRWTRADVRQLIADNPLQTPRYELVDGALIVTPSPEAEHQRAISVIVEALQPFVRAHSIGRVLCSPFDVEVEPESLVQPDIFVVPLEEWTRLRRDTPGRALLLAIEVTSPNSVRDDRGRKRRYYQRNKIAEYWVVDLASRLVERWRPADERPEILTESLEWRPAGASRSLVIDLGVLFAEALGG